MTQDATQLFLSTIETDRDREIELIEADTNAQIQRIYSEAHIESRNLQRTTNVRLRRELSVRRQRETSRAQAELRRKRWQGLKNLQTRLKQQALDKIQMAWQDPDWQWDWCHFWLQAVVERNEDAALRIAISETVQAETLQKIQRWAGKNKLTLDTDASLKAPGLIICWADFELDGLISAQSDAVDAAVLAALTPRLHQPLTGAQKS